MADAQSLEQDAISFARKAVADDQLGKVDTAIFFYCEASQALLSAMQAGSQIPDLIEKANEYISRAEVLRQQSAGANSGQGVTTVSSEQLQLDRARFLVTQAFEEDESNNKDEALELYMQAAELCLKLRDGLVDKQLVQKVTRLAEQALGRAEDLKKTSQKSSPTETRAPDVSPGNTLKRTTIPGPLGFSLRENTDQQANSGRSPQPRRRAGGSGGESAYTKEELQVLRVTSVINGKAYVPFVKADIGERFAFPVPYTDKAGLLALSHKQKSRLGKWLRPDEFCDRPQLIYAISSFSIKQTVVTDCSFVASLAIAAQYERRFRKKLITSLIYPQDRNGDPQYNPCGKYMVKLNINGVPRKVIIDDYLPVSRDGQLLCSFSNNKNELWVSLLEKAYMKVMGGYDFPGSNSNIDLHALTGWIPERVSMKSSSETFDADKEFHKILDRFHKGHCLVTLATGMIPEVEADRAGLVETHAYAMLDIRQVHGYRLFQLKNPWSHLGWKGNFSENDKVHWTSEMKKALNYDPKTAALIDNGVFWIDYESLMKFFDVIYINWDPAIFNHTTCYHRTWTSKEGPKRDSYNIGDNPQYRLEVNASSPSAVWILLTRHITDKEDFADNKEFITLLVYKTNGKRIFYPNQPPPYKDGVRINSPHYLCKMVVEKGTNLFTLVISQYEKNNTIHYTLRVYSSSEFKLMQISEPYNPSYEKQLTGEWKGKTAGGCGNYRDTTDLNPIYQVKIDNKNTDNQLLVELRGPKNYSVGFEVRTVTDNVPNSTGSFKSKTSGDFRHGFCCLELEDLPGGVYNIKPSTFYPNQEGPFFLNISSSVPIQVSRLQ